MLYSEKWLREWVNPALNAQQVADTLTMAGLEVDGVAPIKADFSHVYVGKIIGCEPHPNADKLQVCQVNVGNGSTSQIVCGAPNARAGLLVAVATVGAVLPGNFEIKNATIRDIASSGMLCSIKELGLGAESDGIMELPIHADAHIGQTLHDYLDLNDVLLDIDLTPNRGDCLSIAGIARELSALTDAPLNTPAIDAVVATIDDTVAVELVAPEDCSRYTCRVIKGVDLSKPLPTLITERLRRMGVKQINAVVDLTNYVMMELGQPMHAFDLAKVKGKIVVRRSEGEKLTFLDKKEATIRAKDLVIADDAGAIALAGVIGGLDSSVTNSTVDILLESAYFTPDIIMGVARAYGLHTDASHRYERGVDPDLQINAINRLTHLILAHLGGHAGPLNEAVDDRYLPTKSTVHVTKANCSRIIGIDFSVDQIAHYLSALGGVVEKGESEVLVVAPSHRFDLNAEHDFIEEVARLHGYDNIPTNMPSAKASHVKVSELAINEQKFKAHMVSNGYHEVISYSFVDNNEQKQFHPNEEAIALQNPIADNMGVMRLSLITGLLNSVSKNIRHQQLNMKLFEVGNRYFMHNGKITEQQQLAGIISGKANADFWPNADSTKNHLDFYHAKGDVEDLLYYAGINANKEVQFKVTSRVGFHPYQCAEIYLGDNYIGCIGQLLSDVLAPLNIEQKVFYYELDLAAIAQRKIPQFTDISKYPTISRDLALVVNREVLASDLLNTAREYAGPLMTDVSLFDAYQGKGIAEDKKSLAITMTFQDSSKTLVDEDIDPVMANIIKGLQSKLNAELRS